MKSFIPLALAASMAAPALAATFTVTVGANQSLTFDPTNVVAAMGDEVQLSFVSKNHTVTQSSFDTPCISSGGIDSGFQPIANGSAPTTFTVTINDTNPLWFFCAQPGHCGKGMVFAINPTADKTYDSFLAAAIQQNGTTTNATSSSAAPGASSAGGSSASGSLTSGSATTSPTAGGGSTNGSTDGSSGGSSSSGASSLTSGGILAGLVTLGGLVALF